MAEEIIWTGQSGREYKYWVFDIGTKFKAAAANYIFARQTEPNTFNPIYVGQTSDISERFDSHHKMPCIQGASATHICTHTSSDNEHERLAEESDLVNKWHPPCND